MFFCNSRFITTSKVVNKRVLASIKLNKKSLDKSRNILLNSADSWRKKIYFPNMLSKNSFSWLFKTKFLLFVLNNTCSAPKPMTTPLLKNSVRLYFKNVHSRYSDLFVILCYKNYFLYFPISVPQTIVEKSLLSISKSNCGVQVRDSLLFWINFGLLNIVKCWFSSIEKSLYNYVFLKLRYKGKNHRWHRKKKSLVLRFGHSHLISLKKPTSVFLKKKGRMKIIFFGTNVELLYFFLRSVVNWKPANVYTGRGLRISRQRILRKSGKVSIYR